MQEDIRSVTIISKFQSLPKEFYLGLLPFLIVTYFLFLLYALWKKEPEPYGWAGKATSILGIIALSLLIGVHLFSMMMFMTLITYGGVRLGMWTYELLKVRGIQVGAKERDRSDHILKEGTPFAIALGVLGFLCVILFFLFVQTFAWPLIVPLGAVVAIVVWLGEGFIGYLIDRNRAGLDKEPEKEAEEEVPSEEELPGI